jgi:lipopolysaccharide/colanic/teichoic acid biosynthesis glycosyltransferase
MRRNALRLACKRLLDFTGALTGLILFWPVMAIVALVIRLTLGKPILFRQVRPGRHEQPFTLLKFRSMVDAEFSTVDPSSDAVRLTKTGAILRRFSLDELPQLWNVLKGEMSLVGPRPLLMEYLDYYTVEQAKRHLMKPGITGLAQINGRNALSWTERFRLDVWYVEHWSLWLDLRILMLTLGKIIRQEGVNQPGHATMEKLGVERR